MGEAVAGVHDPAVISISSPHLQEVGTRNTEIHLQLWVPLKAFYSLGTKVGDTIAIGDRDFLNKYV